MSGGGEGQRSNEQRSSLLEGRGALRDETKRQRGRLLALLVDRYLRGEVYSTSLY